MATNYLPNGVHVVNGALTFDSAQTFSFGQASEGNLYLTKNPSASSPDILLKYDTTEKLSLNTRDITRTTGSVIGVQIRPTQSVTNTNSITGAEVGSRINDAIASGGAIGLNASITLKGTTGNISGALHGIQINLDLNTAASPTRTITGDVAGIRFYLQAPSSITYSADVPVMVIATPDTRQWSHFLKVESGNTTMFNATASLGAQIGQILVKVAGTTRCIPYYATS